MTSAVHDYDSAPLQVRSLVVTFRDPPGRLVSKEPLCDQYGSVVDLKVNGVRQFCEESPMIVQPDLLVDTSENRIIGLSFELTSPEWMIPRCKQMLQGLDSRSIRISNREPSSREEYVGLEVLWAQSRTYERMFAQLDFGLWAFLYATPEPSQLRDGDGWTVPEGLVVGDISQLELGISSVLAGDYVNVVAEVVCPTDE